MIEQAKIIGKRTMPPIIADFLRSAYNTSAAKKERPQWQQVKHGILSERWLFVGNTPLFNQMLSGGYDTFFLTI